MRLRLLRVWNQQARPPGRRSGRSSGAACGWSCLDWYHSPETSTVWTVVLDGKKRTRADVPGVPSMVSQASSIRCCIAVAREATSLSSSAMASTLKRTRDSSGALHACLDTLDHHARSPCSAAALAHEESAARVTSILRSPPPDAHRTARGEQTSGGRSLPARQSPQLHRMPSRQCAAWGRASAA